MILLDPDAHPVVAHRGNRAFTPENTLPALLGAVALGADAVEFDLRLSSDGVLVVIHDATLERCTDGSGAVGEHTAAQLVQLDAGFNFSLDGGLTHPWRGRGATVPSFDEAIETLPRNLPCIVELKTADAVEPTRRAIRQHAIAGRIIVAGYDPAVASGLRDSGAALGACTGDIIAMLPRALLGLRASPARFRALCVPQRWHGLPVPIAALARSIHGRGGVTHVWTVNDEAQAQRLWHSGVQGIISDDPARMLLARSRISSR